VVLAALIWIINKTFPMFGEVQRRLDKLNTVMQENLAGVRVIKAFARADHELGRFHGANDSLMNQNITAVRTSAVTMPIMMLTLNFGVVAALWFGGVQVNTGELQLGQLIAFINYLSQTLMSLMMISMLVVRFARSEASAARVQEVLDSQPDLQHRPDALTAFAPQGRLAFENVSFSYQDEKRKTKDESSPAIDDAASGDSTAPSFVLRPSSSVLKEVSFTVEPGQTLAVLGATGAGKSSLANLIPRFYDVNSGRITIDGVDVRDIDEAALHSAIGVALQESILFTGTIRDNIRYGRPDASDDEVIAAAKMAQAHDFISRFPEGYDSVVGQRGVNLSGGQRQRIAIARALLSRPALLIFDDSTSAVDVETEAKIQAALADMPVRPTRVVVAQRISTVLSADMILVLDDGQVAARGTHEQLLKSSPIYQEIYESQMGNGAIIHD
jgi:ATP-binding cassette subfamily B protein